MTLLESQPTSWVIHFVMFLILQRWSGIKWQWTIILILGIEVWEMLDWSRADLLAWWKMFDTWADIICGLLGLKIGKELL